MDIPFLLARLLHVGLGAFWAGTIVFNAAYLMPSIRDAGPDGAKVVAGLMQRRFLDVMPAVAVVTILSGLFLLWRDSNGFSGSYFTSSAGVTFTVGAVVALVAFVLGAAVLRPSMLRAAALSRDAASAPAEQRDAMLSQAQALRMRAGAAGRTVAWLLAASTFAMAIARYV